MRLSKFYLFVLHIQLVTIKKHKACLCLIILSMVNLILYVHVNCDWIIKGHFLVYSTRLFLYLQLCNSIGMTPANYMTIKTCIIKVGQRTRDRIYSGASLHESVF